MASKYKAENEKGRCVACGVCVKVSIVRAHGACSAPWAI